MTAPAKPRFSGSRSTRAPRRRAQARLVLGRRAVVDDDDRARACGRSSCARSRRPARRARDRRRSGSRPSRAARARGTSAARAPPRRRSGGRARGARPAASGRSGAVTTRNASSFGPWYWSVRRAAAPQVGEPARGDGGCGGRVAHRSCHAASWTRFEAVAALERAPRRARAGGRRSAREPSTAPQPAHGPVPEPSATSRARASGPRLPRRLRSVAPVGGSGPSAARAQRRRRLDPAVHLAQAAPLVERAPELARRAEYVVRVHDGGARRCTPWRTRRAACRARAPGPPRRGPRGTGPAPTPRGRCSALASVKKTAGPGPARPRGRGRRAARRRATARRTSSRSSRATGRGRVRARQVRAADERDVVGQREGRQQRGEPVAGRPAPRPA